MNNQNLIEDIERQAQAYWDFMTQEEREQYAWLAGIIDGEGSIVITRPRQSQQRGGTLYYRLQLRVAMTDKATITYIHELTEKCGFMGKHTPKNPKHRPDYKWSVQGEKLASILRRCLPFLHTKKYQALLAIEFTDMQKLEGKGGRGKVLTPVRIARREEIRQRLKELNKRGRSQQDEIS